MQPKHFTALEEKDCLIQSDGEKSYKLRRLEVGKEGAEPRSWVRATPPLGGWDGGVTTQDVSVLVRMEKLPGVPTFSVLQFPPCLKAGRKELIRGRWRSPWPHLQEKAA